MNVVKEFCRERYNNVYNAEKARLTQEVLSASRTGRLSEEAESKIETTAQKEAIQQATIDSMRNFPDVEPADIWKAVYEVHVHRKSGIDDAETIAKVISADQSWKKSSGHAFEEMIKFLASAALEGTGIQIVLQRDLNILIKAGLVTREDGKTFCYGCIQSKTSVRDRVTRDREPSLQAMASYFWSTIIVLDGDFLRLPKFISMVNGGTTEHPTNGWHGLYVFSEQYSGGRIYPTDLNFKNFKEHAIEAAHYWLTQRQWFDHEWHVTE